MLHARIAARAFNTPLLVEPTKAMAFLSGLGPRILGRPIDIQDDEAGLHGMAPTPRASLLTGSLTARATAHGELPFPVIDGIAVIEISGVLIHRGAWIGESSGQTSYEGIAAQIDAAAKDPSVRAVALEIDSFGGEVAGVFDLADKIRALRRDKPVWAFVAEHAFSAGYALASQADRILLPRTGAVGSIGVVVMHADLSGQLDQDGVRVTLIHSGWHKVDGNPFEPLPDAVQADIQRELDILRFLFTETVAAGRGGRLSQDAAMGTEAATYRGAEAIAAGLADEVIELGRGFEMFRQRVNAHAMVRPTAASAANPPPLSKSGPNMENVPMADETEPDLPNTAAEAPSDVTDHEPDPAAMADAGESEPDAKPLVMTNPAASNSPPATTPIVGGAAVAVPSADLGNLAEPSADLRAAAAEIADIAAQAGRLGLAVDTAEAIRSGVAPDALRRLVLEAASAASDARDIVAAAHSPLAPAATESPIIAAAKRAASADAQR